MDDITTSTKSPQLKKDSRVYFAALGKRVAQLRKSLGITQAELARAIGVSQQTVFAYEIGDRRISVLVLVRLARFFDLTVDQFLGFASTPPKKGRVSPRAVRQAERLQALSKTQRRFVVKIIVVLEERNRAS
jgi:transcriptional regulator with XRE-family HTH domain